MEASFGGVKTDYTPLGQRIQQLALEQGLSLRTLAKKANNMDFSVLMDLMAETKRPQAKTIKRLAEALGVEFHELAHLTPNLSDLSLVSEPSEGDFQDTHIIFVIKVAEAYRQLKRQFSSYPPDERLSDQVLADLAFKSVKEVWAS